MFGTWTMGEKALASAIAAVSLIGGIGGPFLVYGELRSDVRTLRYETIPALQKRIDQLEKPAPNTGKGDLCGKLYDGMVSASMDTISGERRQEALMKIAQQTDCFDGVPASMER